MQTDSHRSSGPPFLPVSIIETYRPQRLRLMLFQGLIVAMLLVLAGGLAYRQIIRYGDYGERERLQNQRRVLVPGPRGNIYDRENRLLVGNRSRFAVTLYLDGLRREFRREYIEVVRRYRASEAAGDITRSDRPSPAQFEQISRAQVVQRALDGLPGCVLREVSAEDDLEGSFGRPPVLGTVGLGKPIVHPAQALGGGVIGRSHGCL